MILALIITGSVTAYTFGISIELWLAAKKINKSIDVRPEMKAKRLAAKQASKALPKATVHKGA